VDAAAHHPAALFYCAKGGGDECADRGEDDGGVERLGRRLLGAARPARAKAQGKLLRRRIARAGEGIDTPSLPGGDLRKDMGRGAESVQAERDSVPRHAIAAPADQPGAEQRGGLRVA